MEIAVELVAELRRSFFPEGDLRVKGTVYRRLTTGMRGLGAEHPRDAAVHEAGPSTAVGLMQNASSFNGVSPGLGG